MALIRTKATNKRLRDEIQLNRDRIIEMFGCVCQVCGMGAHEILEIHHVLPLSEGGDNDLYNLSLLCPNCHRAIHEYVRQKTGERISFMLGYILSSEKINGRKMLRILNKHVELGTRKRSENFIAERGGTLG